jgi:hypothetical protein
MSLGVVGLIVNLWFDASKIFPAGFYFFVSLGTAFVSALFLTGWLSSAVARIVPTTETEEFIPEDLIGRTGTADFSIDQTSGRASARDHNHNLQTVYVRCMSGSIPSGQEVLFESYAADGDYYIVSESNLEGTN